MTTILVDCAAQKVYADKQTTFTVNCSHRGNYPSGETNNTLKLVEKSGKLLAGAGCTEVIAEFIEAFPDVHLLYQKTYTNASIFIVEPLKKGVRVTEYEYHRYEQPVTLQNLFRMKKHFPSGTLYLPKVVGQYTRTDGCLTLGSGGKIARFLFQEEGYDVPEVFEMTSRFDTGTGYEYDTVDLNKMTK